MNNGIKLHSLNSKSRFCIYSEFFFGFCVGAWSIAFNFHLTRCGISSAQIGALLSVGYLITAGTSLFIGRIGDKKGYPFVMALGCALMCCSLMMTAIFERLPLFYMSHLIYCAGLACVMSMEFNLPMSLVAENARQYTYNAVLIMYFLGSIVGNTICSALFRILKSENPYQQVLLLCAIIYAGLAVFRGRMPQVQHEASPEQRNRGILTELKGSKVPSFLLYGFLEFGTFTLATGMLNLILRQWRGMSDSMISAIFAINSIMGCLILMMIPKLTRQAKLSDIARAVLPMQCISLLLMTIAPTPLLTVCLLARTASCNLLYTAVDAPMLRSIPQDKRGTYAGMRVFANHIGMSAASVMAGTLVGKQHFVVLYLICTLAAFGQMIVYNRLCLERLRMSDNI